MIYQVLETTTIMVELESKETCVNYVTFMTKHMWRGRQIIYSRWFIGWTFYETYSKIESAHLECDFEPKHYCVT